jgi:hypothetical protein
MRKLSLLAALTLLEFSSVTKASGQKQSFQMWQPIYLDGTIRGNVRGYFEVNPRESEGITKMEQLLIRPGLEYRFSPRASIFAGYCWFTGYQPKFTQEQRLWQQLLFTNQIKKLSIQNRTRLEERIFEHLPSAGVRLRHFLKASYPLTQNTYLVSFEELFLNLNNVRGGPQKGIDQNRVFLGLGRRLSNSARVEVGYQLQYVHRPGKLEDNLNHVLLAQLFWGLRD